MANRRFDRDWALGERIIRIYGSFGTNGTSTPVAANVKGFGFGYAPSAGVMVLQPNLSSKSFLTSTPGITYAATGVYSITFEDPYIDCISFICTMQQTAGNSIYDAEAADMSNLGSSTAAPTLKIQIINQTTGNAVAPPAASGPSRVNFIAVFRDSTVQFNKP